MWKSVPTPTLHLQQFGLSLNFTLNNQEGDQYALFEVLQLN